MENEKEIKKTGSLKNQFTVISCSIIAALLVIFELYVMFVMKDILYMTGAAIILVIDLCILFYALISESHKVKEEQTRKYEEIYNAQKASYLILRKNFMELQNKVSSIELNSENTTENIISAQKAVAKVTISRNKENTDALMNSNDEMIHRFFSFEEKLEDNNKEILKNQDILVNATKQDIVSKSESLEKKMEQMTDMMRNVQMTLSAIEQNQRNIQSQQHPVMMAVQSMQPMDMGQMQSMSSVDMSPAQSVPTVEVPLEETAPTVELPLEETVPEVELPLEETVPEVEVPLEDTAPTVELPLEETVLQEEELPVEKVPEASEEEIDITEPELDEMPIDMPMEMPMDSALEESEKDSLEILPSIDDLISQLENVEPEFEEVTEEAPADDPVASVLSGLDTSDPNKQLSPDEISAMFAAVNDGGAGATKEEPPTPTEDPVASAISGLDLSDPNKKLTPEEISQLFANV